MNSENYKESVGLPVGTRIGKYEIRERLGIGGQAIVYKGYDALLDRYVAIKQISTHLAEDPKFLERFRREAQILAKVGTEQAAIVTIHELIQDERGLFIVMEHVNGHTLEATLNDNPGPVDPKAVLTILWRLAAGLNAVHVGGIIHRDIKPGNIIIGEGLKAKIMDFGVAASATGQTSMVLGTTKYMAPEYHSGKTVDARADMYSLGFIAYEMLLGRAKFNEIFADVVRDRHSEALRWMKWHGNEQVQAPALHEVNPAIPRPLSDIVAKMIAKNPNDRFASMEELGRTIKANFSPRAQAAPASHRKHRRRKAEDSGMNMPAENLVVEPLATAPLPKNKMSSRKKILLASLAAGVILIVSTILIIQSRTESQNRQKVVSNQYLSAESDYNARRFQEAAQKYSKVAKDYPAFNQGELASIMAHLAGAKAKLEEIVAVAPGQEQARLKLWNELSEEQDKATVEARRVQSSKSALSDTVGKLNIQIKEFDQDRKSKREFYTAMDKSAMALEADKFDEANAYLKEGLTNSNIAMTKSMENQVRALQQKIATHEFEVVFVGHLEKAQKAISDRNDAVAKAELRQAQKMIEDESKERVLKDEARQGFIKQYADVDEKATALASYAELMAAIEAAKTADDKAKELSLLNKAIKAKASPEMEARIKELQWALVMEKAKGLAEGGNIAEAIKSYEESLKYKDSAEAKAEIDKLQKGQQVGTLREKADQAFDANDFKTALDAYKKIAALAKDPDVDARIKECEFNVLLAQAKALAEQKKFEESNKALEEARKLMPDKAPEIDAIADEIKQNRDYTKALDMGKKLMDVKDYTKAREELERAQKIKPTEEVKALIHSANYGYYIVIGTAEMEKGRTSEARAYFKMAREESDTPEVRKLLEQVDLKGK